MCDKNNFDLAYNKTITQTAFIVTHHITHTPTLIRHIFYSLMQIFWHILWMIWRQTDYEITSNLLNQTRFAVELYIWRYTCTWQFLLIDLNNRRVDAFYIEIKFTIWPNYRWFGVCVCSTTIKSNCHSRMVCQFILFIQTVKNKNFCSAMSLLYVSTIQ